MAEEDNVCGMPIENGKCTLKIIESESKKEYLYFALTNNNMGECWDSSPRDQVLMNSEFLQSVASYNKRVSKYDIAMEVCFRSPKVLIFNEYSEIRQHQGVWLKNKTLKLK